MMNAGLVRVRLRAKVWLAFDLARELPDAVYEKVVDGRKTRWVRMGTSLCAQSEEDAFVFARRGNAIVRINGSPRTIEMRVRLCPDARPERPPVPCDFSRPGENLEFELPDGTSYDGILSLPFDETRAVMEDAPQTGPIE